jgi:hypothetical protein
LPDCSGFWQNKKTAHALLVKPIMTEKLTNQLFPNLLINDYILHPKITRGWDIIRGRDLCGLSFLDSEIQKEINL